MVERGRKLSGGLVVGTAGKREEAGARVVQLRAPVEAPQVVGNEVEVEMVVA